MHSSRRGFTLIELMIVIGIIVLLLAVVVASFGSAFGKRDNARATATIQTLSSNIASFETRWGLPPPCTLQELADMMRRGGVLNLLETNDTNRGIESLVLALRSGREGGPYLDSKLLADESVRANMDLDSFLSEAMVAHGLDIPEGSSNDLFEILDPWGNPFVYITIAALRAGTVADRITLADGNIVEITVLDCQEKLRHPVTGDYPQGFALWSFGPDGINDYGRGDDITSWPKYGE